MTEIVILVDENDNQIGTGEKIEVHRKALLHRAISIIILNKDGDMLLQKRAKSKYHAGGLWSNACCTHPRPGERTIEAAHRRLKEEMGFDAELEELFTFKYRAELDHGLTEHEMDHVFMGEYNGRICPDPNEADGYSWESVKFVAEDMKKYPEKYTPWFRMIFDELVKRGYILK
ncbi:isopentenyl-diphosphate delta-isomerase [Candidatus Micrarchaeota archaeon]|nr:MAG: isopentenyl-diphosphate delta-isomerase [Candidatus Micrarchaeota archaeon]